MKLLILGGTREAKDLALRSHNAGLDVCYSVAGLVRQPQLPCAIHSGGFRAIGGLNAFLSTQRFQAVLDATHPYAERITAQAVTASEALSLPYWRFERPPWQAEVADNWQSYASWAELLQAILPSQRVFFSAGQLPDCASEQLAHHSPAQHLLRTAVAPKTALPNSVKTQLAIGPFSLEQELCTLRQHRIDVLVSKNSGGKLTRAKLDAARRLGLPVYFLARPQSAVPQHAVYHDLDACFHALYNHANRKGTDYVL